MFETSAETDKIFVAFSKAQSGIKTAGYDSQNPHFRSNYASLKSVMDSILPALNKHGLSVFQAPSYSQDMVTVETVIGHESGQWIKSSISCPVGNKKTAQAIGSVITYLRRYAIQSMTGSTAGVVDDDGNEASSLKQDRPEISNLPQFEETLERNGWSLAWIEKQTLAQGWGSPREWKNDTRSRFIQKEAWTQFSLPEEDVHAV